MFGKAILATGILTLALGTATLFPDGGMAAAPKNALGAIAVSPAGTTLAAAGDNQVLYLLDPTTLAVRQRVHIDTNPLELWYSKDGTTLAMWTTDNKLVFLDTAKWQRKSEVEDVDAVVSAAEADALVTLGGAKRQSDGSYNTPLRVFPLSGGAPLLETEVAGYVNTLATQPDAGGFILMTRRTNDESEPKENPPSDLKGFAKEIFKQQHDAQTSEFIVVDAAGTEVGRQTSWYSQSSAMTGIHSGDAVHFMNYSNDNITVAPDGTTIEMFEGPVSYNYGLGADPAQGLVAVGSLRDGAILSLANGAVLPFKIESKEGWPEYFKGFAFAPDGSVYAGTTSYRVVHISPEGKVLAMQPVY